MHRRGPFSKGRQAFLLVGAGGEGDEGEAEERKRSGWKVCDEAPQSPGRRWLAKLLK